MTVLVRGKAVFATGSQETSPWRNTGLLAKWMVRAAVLRNGRDTLQNFNITGCGLFKLKLLSSLPPTHPTPPPPT